MANEEEFHQALRDIDQELTNRIRGLRATQARLRRPASGRPTPLSTDVSTHLADLARWGFTSRWVDLQRDLWILVFATHPDRAADLFHDQSQALSDPALRRLFLAYDHAYDLDADDPRVDDLAHRIVEATRRRYGSGELPRDRYGLRDPRPHPEHRQRRLSCLAATGLTDSHTPRRVTSAH